tara:strand:+ start:29705 stop:30610 length:906 start_codon:yes stop_codon:yes gene_type:complete
MQIGIIGLGKMGGKMVQRLVDGGHEVIIFDVDKKAVNDLNKVGIESAFSLEELIIKLDKPRVLWLMLPSGDPTEQTINLLSKDLGSGDTIIDGGNSNYKDSIRRSSNLANNGISFLDVGTSGGIWGVSEGYSLMVGGDINVFRSVEPILKTLAPDETKGYGHVGPSGSGHFVKMIHNGIEYGIMQAYAEGFELLNAKSDFNIDLFKVADIWRFGSVIRSWLLDLIASSLKDDADLNKFSSYVDDSGEGRWTLEESINLDVPIPVIALALQARFRSRQENPFGLKLISAMRNQFGGHISKSM